MTLRFFATLLLLLLCGPALADYPDRPIRFIVPSAPGGSPDVLMHILTAELSKRLGVQFVIINRPGANAVIGTPEQFLAIARRERPRWAEIIKRAGARID